MIDATLPGGSPDPRLQTVACPLCGGRDEVTFRTGPDRAHGLEGRFRLARCRACGTVYQNPRPGPAALAAFYPPDYRPHAAPGGPSPLARLGWKHGYEQYRRCRFVARYRRGGALLDVGCATGDFLASIRHFGDWRVWGVEPGLAAARLAHARGLDVVVARFEDLRLAPASLDAVTLWDVLEHLGEPVDALARIRAALRPEGLLFLNVPALDSLDARLFGPYWCGLDLPRHLTLFDRATLAQALERAGLIPVAMAHPTGSHYSFTQSLRQAADDRIADPAARARLRRLSHSPVLRLALTPYFLATEASGRGASLTVAARVGA